MEGKGRGREEERGNKGRVKDGRGGQPPKYFCLEPPLVELIFFLLPGR